MTYFPDVNVWVAITAHRHIHNPAAKLWLDHVATDDIAFCRVSELGLLRLLTNRHVMGEDVLSTLAAWSVYDELRADPRVVLLPETGGFGEYWRIAGNDIVDSNNAWTDGYLAAFAAYAQATVVTFDKKFRAIAGCRMITLSQ